LNNGDLRFCAVGRSCLLASLTLLVPSDGSVNCLVLGARSGPSSTEAHYAAVETVLLSNSNGLNSLGLPSETSIVAHYCRRGERGYLTNMHIWRLFGIVQILWFLASGAHIFRTNAQRDDLHCGVSGALTHAVSARPSKTMYFIRRS
jgi:hypothetical protein